MENSDTVGGPQRPARRVWPSDERWLWPTVVSCSFLFWASALWPGLILSDSFSIYYHVETGGYDTTFSYVYQALLKAVHASGLSIYATVATAFVFQLGMFYALVFVGGRLYFLRQSNWAARLSLFLLLATPVLPLMFSLHSVNSFANLMFVGFLFSLFNVVALKVSWQRSRAWVIVFGIVVAALRTDMAPPVWLGIIALCCQSPAGMMHAWARFRLFATAILALLLINLAIPRCLGVPSNPSYVLSLVFHPLDKIISDDPQLLTVPAVREPIEAVIGVPAERIVGHGDDIYWWSFDHQPSAAKLRKLSILVVRLVIEHFDVFVGDRATMLIRLMGSKKTDFVADHLYFLDHSPFEDAVSRWHLRDFAFPHRDWVKGWVVATLPRWTPASPTYYIWNSLPFFVLFVVLALLYPMIPATALISALIVLRMVILALTAPYPFYFYSSSLPLAGLLLAVPCASWEWSERRRSPSA